MEERSARLTAAERDLEQAAQILAHPVNYHPEEWMLLSTLVGEADLIVREEQRANADLRVPLLQEVVKEFREITANFTDSTFLRASRAARRRNRSYSPAALTSAMGRKQTPPNVRNGWEAEFRSAPF